MGNRTADGDVEAHPCARRVKERRPSNDVHQRVMASLREANDHFTYPEKRGLSLVSR
jgi:hypothetical protein